MADVASLKSSDNLNSNEVCVGIVKKDYGDHGEDKGFKNEH